MAPMTPVQGTSIADGVAESVWRLGGLVPLIHLLDSLPGPVICPHCQGLGAIFHREGKAVTLPDGRQGCSPRARYASARSV